MTPIWLDPVLLETENLHGPVFGKTLTKGLSTNIRNTVATQIQVNQIQIRLFKVLTQCGHNIIITFGFLDVYLLQWLVFAKKFPEPPILVDLYAIWTHVEHLYDFVGA